MRSIRRCIRNFGLVFLGAGFSLAPAWADDTEIFFAEVSEGEISPNILFIVDTSGSMSNTVSGTGKTRMQNVQDALKDMLNNLFDVNVGMMRFSNPGGPLLYQVDYIDRHVNETEAGIIDVTTILSDNDDDAQEVVSSGQVITDDTALAVNLVTMGTIGSWTERVNDGDNDSEQEIWNDRCSENDTTYLEMTHNDSSSELQAVGIRISSIGVPLNATITNAYIRFTAVNVDAGGRAEIDITAEARDSGSFDDRGSYCDDSEKDNITGRSRSGSTVQWDLNQNLAAEQTIVTPTLTSIVQEVVDHADWGGDSAAEENDIVFIFERRSGSTATGRYDFYARDGSSSKAPQLHLEYYVGAPPENYPAKTGVRFQRVNVPKGVTVTHATIDFTVSQADAAQATRLVIYGEDDDEPAAFDSAVTSDISNRIKTSAAVNWTPGSWTTVNTTQSTPNIKAIIQEIVSRGDWCGGDDMAFIIEGSGLRNAYARDEANGYQPVLNIQYEEDSVVAGSSCMESTLTKAVISSLDDAEEDGSYVTTTSSQLDITGSNKVGLRFTSINLPEDAPIRSAYLKLYSNDDDGGTMRADIKVQVTGDAEAFSGNNGTIDSRSWSSAVSWTDSNDRSNNEVFRTPDLASLVQSIVDRGDWTLGNDIAFLVDFTSGDDRNVASYDGSAAQAARLIVTFEDDGTETDIRLVRDELIDVVDALNTQGYTPIQDTLYEAALYLRAGDVDYGAYRGGPNDSGPHSYTRVSVADSMVTGSYAINRPSGCSADNLGASACDNETISGVGGNPQYETPIDDFCQKSNHLILLTDGQANRPHSDTKIKSMAGVASCLTHFEDTASNTVSVQPGEECVLDLVRYMNSADQSDLKQTQTITTHTVGFNFSSPWLKAVARYGGGLYKEATNAAELVTEVEAILEEVLEVDSTFVAPVVSINQFSRLNHRNEIYFAVFRPTDSPGWPGNLKKYRLRTTDNEIIDYDGDGKEAISDSTGFFKDDARSDWAASNDGAVVESGGAFAQLPSYTTRHVYVSYSGMAEDDLAHSSNGLTTSNGALTKAMFGESGMSDAEFDAHIEWIRGKDVDETYPVSIGGSPNGITAENRYSIGDPLHSKPIAITYGGTEANPDITVFYGTNAGFLHAIDSVTGVERFAYLPEDLFGLQSTLRKNSHSTNHQYGIDGNITARVEDVDGDGHIESGDGDFARLYFGMRRGGRNYYALDVTDRDHPKLMWVIKGGQGSFTELGQSWAQPRFGKIKFNATDVDVLYLSGGYDVDQDDSSLRSLDDVGRAMYIVNAETGALIWSGGDGGTYNGNFDDMLYAIPATPAVIQLEDDYDDIILVGDMGGQVWRFDIHNGVSNADDLVTGGVIADLGVADGTNTAARNRRFYHRPNPALVNFNGTEQLAVTIGSGYRAHPLDVNAQDRFYMLLQGDFLTAPASYTKLTESDLYDGTDNAVGEGSVPAAAALAASEGWYFDLPRTGEKVLSSSSVTDDSVVFTTYEPSPNAVASNCVPSAGVSRVYMVDLETGSPVRNWDSVDGYTEDDRSRPLKTTSMVDQPVIICTGAGCDTYVGTEKADNEGRLARAEKTFWRVKE